MSESNNSSVWRIILSVCITLFLAVRIAIKCSGNNSGTSNNNYGQIDDMRQVLEKSRQRASEMRHDAWKEIFYRSYQKLDSLASDASNPYGITKLSQDSLVRIDLKSKIRIPKESFYINNYDDTLRFAVKFVNGTNFLRHDVESNEKTNSIFKTIKGSALFDLKSDEKTLADLQIIEYKLRKSPRNYNGIAAVSKSEGLMNFIQFESPDKTSAELKVEMTKFLMDNLVENK